MGTRRATHGRLAEIRRLPSSSDQYPFSIPAIGAMGTLPVADVTFFVGENGSGKSTLLEAVAVRSGLNAEGGSLNLTFETRPTISPLHEAIELVWHLRPRRAFFLRAETFYNTATAYESVGIAGYHDRSHGESFLEAVEAQIIPPSFVLMDEPESALSVLGQLKLLRLMHELVGRGCQFIIATHSPILLAFPGGAIWNFDDDGITPIAYDDTEAVQLTRSFLNAPERFLRQLLED